MTFVKKLYDAEGGCFGMESSFNKCFGVGSESQVTNDDVIWFISREEFAVDTFVLCK